MRTPRRPGWLALLVLVLLALAAPSAALARPHQERRLRGHPGRGDLEDQGCLVESVSEVM
jgi:hypothetical protein